MSGLTVKIRAKYPKVYDDMDDATLEKAILAKHPEYKDLATKPTQQSNKTVTAAGKPKTVPVNKPISEPTTLWGGRLKGFVEGATQAAKDLFVPNKEDFFSMLESAAHPQTTGDFLNLVIPNAAVNLERAIGAETRIPRGRMSQVAEAAVKPQYPVDEAGRVLSDVPLPTEVERAIASKTNPDLTLKPATLDVYDLARQKQQMGLDMPPELSQQVRNPLTPKELPADDWTRQLAAKPVEQGFDPSTLDFGTERPSLVQNLISDESGFIGDKSSTGPEPFINNEIDPIPSQQPVGDNQIRVRAGNPAVEDTARQMFEPAGKYATGDAKFKFNTPEEAHAVLSNDKEPSGLAQGLWDLTRGLRSVDLPYLTSASFRQGSRLAGTKAWREAWIPAVKAFHSEDLFNASQAAVDSHPLVKSGWAKSVGLEFTDLKNLTSREEVLRSDMAEKIPVHGHYVRASNREFTSFMNNVRLGATDKFVKLLKASGLDPTKDLALGKELAEAVNTLSGRGKLAVEYPTFQRGGKYGFLGKGEVSIERAAKFLSNTLWSPRAIASNIRMVNPTTYMFGNPILRRQHMYGLLRQIGTWGTLSAISGFAGATVLHGLKDLTNPDYGKIKIGNTRIDPPAGLQQYLVAMTQEMTGGKTSSKTKEFTPFGQGPFSSSPSGLVSDFIGNREHPSIQLAASIANILLSVQAKNDKYTKNQKMVDQAIQAVLPMYISDIAQILEENPDMADEYKAALGITGAVASSVGMGVQSYHPKSQFGKPIFSPMFMEDRNTKPQAPKYFK